jgi:hypothetical protein
VAGEGDLAGDDHVTIPLEQIREADVEGHREDKHVYQTDVRSFAAFDGTVRYSATGPCSSTC